MAEQRRQEIAGEQADAIIRRLGLTAPVDPLAVVSTEGPFLRAGGRNFGNRYDGKLEYHRTKSRFLLFYNTKYDTGYPPGMHHPRTRFSIAHELGHYFIESHRAYLLRGGKPHSSTAEFRSDVQIERQADTFAASLLLPTHLARPIVNKSELSTQRIESIASDFQTSLVSTVIRCVRLSDFPCAVAGIRAAAIAWMFPSDALIKGGCYPGGSALRAPFALKQWEAFAKGMVDKTGIEGQGRNWFATYERDDLLDLYVTEHYLPVPVMETLVVLLTVDEDDLSSDEDEQQEDFD